MSGDRPPKYQPGQFVPWEGEVKHMRLTHYRVEVLYRALDGAACAAPRGKLSEDPAEITCPKCRKACGFDD